MATYYYEIDLNDNGNQKPVITKYPPKNFNQDVATISIDDSSKKIGEESVVILNTERMYKFFILNRNKNEF